MRNTAERTAAVKSRATRLEYKSRLRKSRAAAGVSAAASLLLITALSLAMPGLEKRSAAVPPAPGTAASLFAGSSALGYIAIGILAFVLGTLVTILCLRLKKWVRSADETSADIKSDKTSGGITFDDTTSGDKTS